MRRRPGLVPLALIALSALGCGKKAEPVVDVPTSNPPAPAPVPPPPAPATNPTDPNAEAARVTAAVRAELGNVIHFDYDQDAIKPEDRPILDRKAAILQANASLRIRISGHADDRGSDEYNLVLGNKRALAAKRYLESKGIAASRIDVASFGEERPADPGQNETSWAMNRRDEFEIIAGGERLVQPR
ncbi:MAG: OmpA family protein [Gemmatimonadales bacterium]|nr:OmpA family protein [Gemmatimonadales bacterium]